jgi:hypothetical protein
MKKKREEHGDSEVVLRFMRVLKALGPHADDFVLRYKEASHVNLREVMGRLHGLRHDDVDPLGLCSARGLVGILCITAVALASFGVIVAVACLGVGLGLRFQAGRQIYQFYLDRAHLTHAASHFELLEPCLRGKDGMAEDIVAGHIEFTAITLECGVFSLSGLSRIVDTASYLGFVSPCVQEHRERARRKIRLDQERFGIPRQTEFP